MATSKMTKLDLQYQAESDARTMAAYQEIMNDKSRMNRAIKEANKQADSLNQRANAMRSAANMKSNTRTSGRKK